MAPVKGSCKKGVFGRCFGAVSTATFFSLETRRKKKDSMRQRTEKREKFSFFYKRVFISKIRFAFSKNERQLIYLKMLLFFPRKSGFHSFFEPDLLHRTFLENRGLRNSNKKKVCNKNCAPLDRTNNRIRYPRWEVSSWWWKVCKGSRQIGIVPSEESLAGKKKASGGGGGKVHSFFSSVPFIFVPSSPALLFRRTRGKGVLLKREASFLFSSGSVFWQAAGPFFISQLSLTKGIRLFN